MLAPVLVVNIFQIFTGIHSITSKRNRFVQGRSLAESPIYLISGSRPSSGFHPVTGHLFNLKKEMSSSLGCGPFAKGDDRCPVVSSRFEVLFAAKGARFRWNATLLVLWTKAPVKFTESVSCHDHFLNTGSFAPSSCLLRIY